MITPTTGAVKVQVIKEMAGLPFGLKFFDDDHNIYVSQEVYDSVTTKKDQMRYMVMSWRKSQMTIHEAVNILLDEIEKYGKETGQIN